MQNKIINIDDIAEEIAEMVKAETEDTKKAADEAAKKAITKARDELTATSPRRTGKTGGKYARGWKTRKAEKFYEAYNSTRPQITHLLNNGHAKQNGGRVPGDHHIDTAETNANRNFWDELNGRLK